MQMSQYHYLPLAPGFFAILVGLFESYASFFDSSLKEVFVFGALIPILVWQSMRKGSIEEEIEEEEHEKRA